MAYINNLHDEAIQALKIVASPEKTSLAENQSFYDQFPWRGLVTTIANSHMPDGTPYSQAIEGNLRRGKAMFRERDGFSSTQLVAMYSLSLLATKLPSEEEDMNMHDLAYSKRLFSTQSSAWRAEPFFFTNSSKVLEVVRHVMTMGFDSQTPMWLTYIKNALLIGRNGDDFYPEVGFYSYLGFPNKGNQYRGQTPALTYPSWAGNFLRGKLIGIEEFQDALSFATSEQYTPQPSTSRYWRSKSDIRKRY
jgi:hypothetical protein